MIFTTLERMVDASKRFILNNYVRRGYANDMRETWYGFPLTRERSSANPPGRNFICDGLTSDMISEPCDETSHETINDSDKCSKTRNN